MKTGDKVRFVHSTGSGIVRKIIDLNTVEVEIEDGFMIPVLRNEIVVIAAEEKKLQSNSFAESTSSVAIHSGVFLAFTPFNDKITSLAIVNETDLQVLYTFNEIIYDQFHPVAHGIVQPMSYDKIKELQINQFENWPEFNIQMIKFGQRSSVKLPVIDKNIKLKASTFFKSKKYNPVIKQDSFLYQLDQDSKPISASQLQENLLENKTSSHVPHEKPANEIDLHIEKLTEDFSKMNKTEILNFQINSFEKNLENAIASNMLEITFIHGTGNGVLKNLIHKKLAANKMIKFFQDGRKEKFGYGATLVKIK